MDASRVSRQGLNRAFSKWCGSPRAKPSLLGFSKSFRLNCKQNAGRANRSAHDIVQPALKKELQRLSRSVVDDDAELRARYSHLTSKKRGDLAITSFSYWQLYDPVSRRPRSDFIAHVKMVSLVNSRGTCLLLGPLRRVVIRTNSRIRASCNRNRLKSGNMQIFMPLLVSLSFLLWSPVLALLVLLLFKVSFLS